MMPSGQPITIGFTGGMNNRDTPLGLFLRQKGEVSNLVNADTTYNGKLKLLRPLAALNVTALGASIHTIFRAQDWIFVGASTTLYYMAADGNTLTSLITGLSGNPICMIAVGDWVFVADGTNRKSIYIGGTTPTECDWGQDVPSVAPTVATGAAGNPNGDYSCYYRYKITLPDGAIIRTDLSPVAAISPASEKIEWSGLVHASFTGATTNEIELFRTKDGWSAKYLVTTISEGTTTYSDNVDDTTLQGNTEFDESGYYPPPDNPDLIIYHPSADRIFIVVDNDVYWTEAALYHIVLYSSTAGEYTSINSVYLSGENITGMAMFDEQLYFGSKRTWRRLRGKNPSYWEWEPTSAIKGPVSWRGLVTTLFGLVYPATDGYLYLFQGIDSRKIAEHFIFDTKPTSSSWAAFDGRFFHLFYADATYPELILDLMGWPSGQARAIRSTRNYTACHYNIDNDVFYAGDSSGYLRSGEDTDAEVALTFQTAEIPVERLVDLGDAGSLLIDVDTGGDELTITPIEDDEQQEALTAITHNSRTRDPVPININTYRAISFLVTVTTNQDIELREPWLIRKGDDD